MKSFRHRPVSNDPTDVIDETEDGCGNDQGSQTKKKKRGPTKLRRPPNGQQIRIKPVGEEQSESVNEGDEEQMSIGGQITTILKLEYPSIIEETPKKTFYARTWAHYAITEDDEGMTAADRFRKEFWSIYSVDEGDRLHAEEVLERFAAKQCRNMMYELRVTAVKDYYDNIKQPITDPVARNILLREAQYLKVKPEWISEGAWCKICAYWCSVEFLRKRRFAQKSRLQPDFTQNRGGSRPHSQTKQFLGRKYGPESATDINTYCCMKSGVKNCDSNGKSGPIPTEKVQRRVDDFGTLEALHPDDYEQRKNDKKVDAEVVYQSSGNGLAHGHVPIANGAVRKCEMKASGKASSMTRQSNSGSYQYLLRRNAQLEKGYKIGLAFCKHMPMNMPVPEDIAAILQEANTCAPSSDQVSQSWFHAENRASGNGDGASGNGDGEDASGNGNDSSSHDDSENGPI